MELELTTIEGYEVSGDGWKCSLLQIITFTEVLTEKDLDAKLKGY